MQINTGSHEWVIMSWSEGSPMQSPHPWRLIGPSRFRRTRKRQIKRRRETNRFWVIQSFAKICRIFMSCFVVWGLVLAPTVRGAQRVCPGLLSSLASPCYLVQHDEQETRERSCKLSRRRKIDLQNQRKTWTGKEKRVVSKPNNRQRGGFMYTATLLFCFLGLVLVELTHSLTHSLSDKCI